MAWYESEKIGGSAHGEGPRKGGRSLGKKTDRASKGGGGGGGGGRRSSSRTRGGSRSKSKSPAGGAGRSSRSSRDSRDRGSVGGSGHGGGKIHAAGDGTEVGDKHVALV